MYGTQRKLISRSGRDGCECPIPIRTITYSFSTSTNDLMFAGSNSIFIFHSVCAGSFEIGPTTEMKLLQWKNQTLIKTKHPTSSATTSHVYRTHTHTHTHCAAHRRYYSTVQQWDVECENHPDIFIKEGLANFTNGVQCNAMWRLGFHA